MDAKTIANYGGPKADATPVQNPETDVDSDEWNRLTEDVAQLTQAPIRAACRFATTNTAAPTTYAAASVSSRSLWGTGSAQKPTVAKTATGRYTITYSSSFEDGLEATENVSFFSAQPHAWSADVTDSVLAKIMSIASNVVTIAVESPIGTLADLGDQSGDPINIELWTI